MIKFLLNHIPRPVLQRAARWAMPVVRFFYAGRRVECPVCGARLRRFLPYGYVETRKDALCPGCLSLERHRLLWLWLCRETDLLHGGKKFLHVAPEVCLSERFEKIYAQTDTGAKAKRKAEGIRNLAESSRNAESNQAGEGVQVCQIKAKNSVSTPRTFFRRILCGRMEASSSELDDTPIKARTSKTVASAEVKYITADLESPLARVKMDVQYIPFADGTFDVVMCNHVLEHVADDRQAMRELFRVTKRGGWGVLLSPVDEAREETFEDDRITDQKERTRLFGQYDHRRVYGRDYADRLREAGWSVEKIDYLAQLPDAEKAKYGLRYEPIYVVRK